MPEVELASLQGGEGGGVELQSRELGQRTGQPGSPLHSNGSLLFSDGDGYAKYPVHLHLPKGAASTGKADLGSRS